MSGHPPRPRRVADRDPGCARDCIHPREQARLRPGPDEVQPQGGGRRRQARNESTDDLLRQLPAALGGYRAPVNVDRSTVGQSRQQGGLPAMERGQRRAASVDAQQRPPWAVDSPERHEHQALGARSRPPWSSDVAPGALTIDFSAQRRNRAQGIGQQRQPPWGVDDSSLQPRSHARDSPDSLAHLPDIRNPRRGGRGRDSPHGGALPGQRRRVQSESPVGRRQGWNTPDGTKNSQLAGFVSQAADANLGFRPYMEDRYIAVDPFIVGEGSSEQWGFFAVYDGHGGTQAAELCNQELHKHLSGHLLRAMKERRRPGSPLTDEAIADALTQSFQSMDEQLLKIGAYNLGTTATVALARRAGGKLQLHVANVGDSRALAIDNARRHARVSQDHRPSDESEVRRVRQAGGFINMGRVSGVLAVSRALGDHAYKGGGVTWQPTISVRDATNDMALVIASDGVWDYMEDDEVRAIIETGASERTFDLASRVVGDAKRRGTTDNTSCLVIFW